MKRLKKRPRGMTELILKHRGSWHGINPVTRVDRDRKKYTRKGREKSTDWGNKLG